MSVVETLTPQAKSQAIEPRLQNMALGIARAYMRRLPASVCREDLEQAALIGLVDGLRRHPGGEGPGYDCYLRLRIRGGIVDELRAQDWSSRRSRKLSPTECLRVVHLDDVDERWGDVLGGAFENPETAAIARLDGAKALRAPIGARDANILRQLFERGRPQREVGDDEGISEARVSQRVACALARMRDYLTRTPPMAERGAPHDVGY